jgi:hypothetical protein
MQIQRHTVKIGVCGYQYEIEQQRYDSVYNSAPHYSVQTAYYRERDLNVLKIRYFVVNHRRNDIGRKKQQRSSKRNNIPRRKNMRDGKHQKRRNNKQNKRNGNVKQRHVYVNIINAADKTKRPGRNHSKAIGTLKVSGIVEVVNYHNSTKFQLVVFTDIRY